MLVAGAAIELRSCVDGGAASDDVVVGTIVEVVDEVGEVVDVVEAAVTSTSPFIEGWIAQ